MAELEPVEPLVALLRDIDARRVSTADDFAVILDLPDGTRTTVTEMAGEIEGRGWAYEPAQDRTWQITPAGRWVLDGGGSRA